jgi:hypothetical protein
MSVVPGSRVCRFLTIDLSLKQVEAIVETRMDPRHDHLNALLDDN